MSDLEKDKTLKNRIWLFIWICVFICLGLGIISSCHQDLGQLSKVLSKAKEIYPLLPQQKNH